MSIAVPLYGFGASGGTGGTLTVTAPANVTVTVSKDGKSKIKNSGTSGVVVFKGLASGTWTVTITSDGKTAQKNVVVTTDYSTVIAFFAATINITYPAGSTCTCSDGTTTLSAPDTSGTWACIVPNAGTWTITSTKGGDSATQDVAITRLTVEYVTIIYRTTPDFTYTGDYEVVDDSDNPISDFASWKNNWKIRFLTSGTLTFTKLNGWNGQLDVFLVGGGGDGGNGQDNSDTGGYWSGAGGGSGFTTTESITIKAGVDYSISIPSAGGNAQAFGKTALHGNNGTSEQGGRGGSGGGQAGFGGGGKGGKGGVDGSNGGGPGGAGQGTTTREFGESAGKLYATGGDGASGYTKAPTNQVSNSGNGGGGGGFRGNGSAGSSGIVIIRNARRTA